MKKILPLIYFLMSVFYTGIAQQNAADVFISEYCEYNQTVSSPQYFNHYIELYNGTGDSIDMSKYQLWRSLNATGWNLNTGSVPVAPLSLKGYLKNNATYVITRPNTGLNPISIAADSAQSWFFLNISGNDAIALAKDTGGGNFAIIDLIGSSTVDPGSYWSVAGVTDATMNHVMVRKPSVCGPDSIWATSAGTDANNSEWIVRSQNDIADINKHSCYCNGLKPDTIILQDTATYKYSALFIGNSYTYYNEIPAMVNAIANTVGDTLITAQSTPGGWTLEQHFSTAATLNLLKAQSYDYVVLQEQSQRPALDSVTTAYKFFKYATYLDSLRKIYSPCGQTMYYMTWGKKGGDNDNCSTYPAVCTFDGMDSVLNVRYREAQAMTSSLIAPVGAVRNYLIKNHPEIELYIDDNKHPSHAGSFVSAATFYACMFKKDPTLTTYNYDIGDAVADTIKAAVKHIVYDSLSVWNNYNKHHK